MRIPHRLQRIASNSGDQQVHQESFSVVADIDAESADELALLLGDMSSHQGDWDIIPFAALEGVHFARLFIMPQARLRSGERLPARLCLFTNVDAPLSHHVHQLATDAADGIDRLFSCCVGYPAADRRTGQSRLAFLQRNALPSQVFYVNTNGRSVQQLHDEETLRVALEEILDRNDFSNANPATIRRTLIEHVESTHELRWALEAAKPPGLRWRCRQLVQRLGWPLLILLLSPLLLAVAPLFLLVLYVKERSDQPDESLASPATVRALRADEDFGWQNQFIATGEIKAGLFRRLLTRGLLAVADYAVRHIYNRGQLSGLNTIHFARWTLLDSGQRVVFVSNYDGSLESYMSDFIDKAAWGLNAIFSQGEGFPRTSFLFCRGIRDEQAYKRFLPTRQLRSQVFWSAYRNLSTKNMANNSAIRAGLKGPMNSEQACAWLRRFGAGNELPASSLVARMIDSIPWNRICRSEHARS